MCMCKGFNCQRHLCELQKDTCKFQTKFCQHIIEILSCINPYTIILNLIFNKDVNFVSILFLKEASYQIFE